jgi:hypothetical protein
LIAFRPASVTAATKAAHTLQKLTRSSQQVKGGLSAPELSFAAQTRHEEQFVSASPRNH